MSQQDHVEVLEIIRENKGITFAEIATKYGYNSNQLTSIMYRLIEKDLIKTFEKGWEVTGTISQ